jgi:hypothetical protein
VTLAADPRGLLVTWQLVDVALDAGDLLGQLPASIAGAPTIRLEDGAVATADEAGPVPLVMSLTERTDGEVLRCWSVARSTVGPIEGATLQAADGGLRQGGRGEWCPAGAGVPVVAGS